MNITEISVKRPAAICMIIALLVGLGIIGYTNLGADLMPTMKIPVITISTTYAGASAEDIKEDIVKPIEDAVSGISGIDKINSTSRESYGMVIVTFKMDTDMNSALIDIQKCIDNVQGKLPKDADKPVLYKVDMNEQPIITLALTGSVPYDELYNQADKIKSAMEKQTGVGQVQLLGADKKQLMVELDKTAMEYYGVSSNTLLAVLNAGNISMPSGTIKHEKSEETVRVVGQFQKIDEVKNLLIPTVNGGTVRLDDIAKVTLDYPDATTIMKLNGKKTIALQIQKQSDANVVEVANKVKKEVEVLKKSMPSGVNMTLVDDSTIFINSALDQIKSNLIEGVITTAIVLLFFLRSWKSSLIVLIAIPTSLIATFFMMYEFKFTLNMLSLMGLSLCIGILVDDSIVVLENIQRHLSLGKNPISAAIEGRSEIGMAAVAITLCDVVVFLPVAFMGGLTGQVFKQFGLTIVFATLFSLFISFTVTPMMASRIYKNKKPNENEAERKTGHAKSVLITKIFGKMSKIIDDITKAYSGFLEWSLVHRGKVLISVILCLVISIALIPMGLISSEFVPSTDQSSLTINMTLSAGSTLNQTDEKIVAAEKYLHSLSEVQDYFSVVGSNNDKTAAQIYVMLVPKSERKRSQSDMAKAIRSWGKKMPGVDFNVSEASIAGGGGNGKPISISIVGDNDNVLKDISDEVEKIVKSVPGIVDLSNSSRTSGSEIRVKVDRMAASQYGVSVSDVAAVLRTGISGSPAGVYRGDDDEYDMTVKFMDGSIKSTDDLGAIKIANSSGQQIPLSQLASIEKADSQKTIPREDRQDRVTISANIQGRVLGDVSKEIRDKLNTVSVPIGYKINYGGDQQQMTDTFSALVKALAASIVLVYMILVVLYESFLTPFIRLLSLPCAIIGAFTLLAVTGKSLNLLSMIGLIMLDGLASKNGTLLIDYTNTLMKRGIPLKEALITAGKTRLRPIMMTSVTMIVGMLPAALSLGDGSEFKSSMAVVIIGGMITSTILSPIVLPIVYTLMDDLKNSIDKKRNKISQVSEVQQYES